MGGRGGDGGGVGSIEANKVGTKSNVIRGMIANRMLEVGAIRRRWVTVVNQRPALRNARLFPASFMYPCSDLEILDVLESNPWLRLERVGAWYVGRQGLP